MTDEVLDFLSGLQQACRRGHRTKVKELSFEAWLEIQGLRSTDRLHSSRPVDLVKGGVV